MSRRGKRGGRNRGNRRERGDRIATATLPVVRQNALLQGNGANTYQDRAAGQTYASATMNPYFLNNYVKRNQEYLRMYNTSWEVQKMITIPVDDALKYRPELQGLDERDADLIWELYDEKRLDQQNRRAFIQQRLFGGCVQFGVFRRDARETVGEPLRLSAIRPGDFEAVNVIDPTQLSIIKWADDPFSPDYDETPDYCIQGIEVDKSRMIVFDGQSLVSKAARNRLEAGRYNPLGFGESKLTTLYDILRYCAGTQEGAYHLVNLASVLLVEAENLRMMRANNSKAYEALEAIVEQVSIYRGAVLEGKNVKISQHAASFGSVPELLMMYLQIFSAASDVPATRFLNQAPGGLNATGESDTQNYHDNIRSFQQQQVKPTRQKQIDWIGCSLWGWEMWKRKRASLKIVDAPLWSETSKEKAERIAIYAGIIQNLYSGGAISGEAAVKELKAREVFATDIEAVEFLDDGPEMEDDPTDGGGIFDRLEKTAPRKAMAIGNAGDWDEDKHPRADDGKFGKGGGENKESEGSGEDAADASEWGEAFPEFTGKPAEAIEHLLKEKRGYVPGAFSKEGIGPIDLPWGRTWGSKEQKGYGLKHIIARRTQDGYDGEAFARELPRLIKEGRVEKGDADNTVFIFHERRKAVIKLDWHDKKRTWLVTAYDSK